MALNRRWVLVIVPLVVVAGCTKRDAPRTLGRAVVSGPVTAMRASPDGGHLAFLHDCRPLQDRALPRDAGACALSVVPSTGGAAVRVAAGVTTLGHGFGWARSGHLLAALGEYQHAEGRGTLVVWDGAAPRTIATGVTFHAFDRAGTRLAWITGGQLFVADASGSTPVRVEGAANVSTFEFGGEQGRELVARRTGRAGGALLWVTGASARPLTGDVHEYGFSDAGGLLAFTAGAARSLSVAATAPEPRVRSGIGRDVQSFLFAPRADRVAFVADAAPGRQGDLWTVAVAGDPVRLGRRVGEPRWTRDGARLAWLQEYDPRSRTGALAVGGGGAPPRVVARNVSDFDVTRDGAIVAGLVHDTAAGYSVNLVLAAGDAGTVTVARGVFGFGFSPDGKWLYYRTICVREAEACDILRIPAAGLPSGGAPERIAEGAKSFEFAPGRPDRLLVTWSRKDRVALDLALWEAGKLVSVDTSALPGSVRFLGGSATRLGWIGNDPKRPGVYVAEVP